MPTEKKMTGYPSIDKPWLKFYDTQFDEKKLPKKTMYELAFEQNKSNMSNVAIDIRMSANNFDKGITITYKEFFNRIQKCAKAAKKIGFMENCSGRVKIATLRPERNDQFRSKRNRQQPSW